jgi:protein-disulfide isomerase
MKQTLLLATLMCCGFSLTRAAAPEATAAQCTIPRKGSPVAESQAAVAVAAGAAISQRELDDATAGQMMMLRNQEYQVKSKVLDEIIKKRLIDAEAKKRALTVEQLYAQEVDSKISKPTDGEVAAFKLALSSQAKGAVEQSNAQIQAELRSLEIKQARLDYVSTLREKSDVEVMLLPPTVNVTFDRKNLRGDQNAPITIVEFADYQCPYCKQAEATVAQVLEKYAGRVSVAFRDFPLTSIHPYAEKASEAARCAAQEGKFWEFHDALFASQSKLDESSLFAIAQTTGLNAQSFRSCLGSGESRPLVSHDQEDGKKAGISSTPGFFVNGVFLSGAQPEAAFEKVIDEQLKMAKKQTKPTASAR